jgi:hypothetical protein
MKKQMAGWAISLLAPLLLAWSSSTQASDCGTVQITNVTVGPAHGAMMQISSQTCGGGGYSGWICLDPEGQHMSLEKSRRVYAFVLSQYLMNSPVHVWIADGVYTSACGNGYPVLQEIRSP